MSEQLGHWREIQKEQLQDCRVFSVHKSIRQSPYDGSEHDFYLIDTPEWVNIVPVTQNHEVVCVRQFRHGTNSIALEIPGGLIDPGENPAQAAVRECLEETGYKVADIESLGILKPNPALFPNDLHTYVARGAEKVSAIANTIREHTEVELVPISQIAELLINGEIDHALVVATLWRFLWANQNL